MSLAAENRSPIWAIRVKTGHDPNKWQLQFSRKRERQQVNSGSWQTGLCCLVCFVCFCAPVFLMTWWHWLRVVLSFQTHMQNQLPILGCFSIHSLWTAVYSSPWSPGLPGEWHKCTQDGQESNPGPSYSEVTADNNYSTTPFMFSANLVCNLEGLSLSANLHILLMEPPYNEVRVFSGKLHV